MDRIFLKVFSVSVLFSISLSVYAGPNYDRPGKGVTCYNNERVVYESDDPEVDIFERGKPELLRVSSKELEKTGEVRTRYREKGQDIVCFSRPKEPQTECYLDGLSVFRSQRASIEVFDAKRLGYTLIFADTTQTQDVYTFLPGPVYCTVEVDPRVDGGSK